MLPFQRTVRRYVNSAAHKVSGSGATFIGTYGSGQNTVLTTYTFSSVPISTDTATRVVIAGVTWFGSTPTLYVLGVTCAGVSLTQAVGASSGSPGGAETKSEIWYGNIDASHASPVSFVVSMAGPTGYCSLDVLVADNLGFSIGAPASTTGPDVFWGTSSPFTASSSLVIGAGGFGIGFGNAGPSWSSPFIADPTAHEATNSSSLALDTIAGTFTPTMTGTTAYGAMCSASWHP